MIMPRKQTQWCTILVSLLLPLLIGGCIGGTSQQSAYYIFSPSSETLNTPSLIEDAGIGIGPIKLPGFLKRPHIVTRDDKNLISINEFHRWGDSLEEQISVLLVENFSVLLNTSNVGVYPWEKSFKPAYQLFVDFRQLDGKINESVTLNTVWWLVDIQTGKRRMTKRSKIMVPLGNEGYKDYVTALNTALDHLSREMAQDLIRLQP